MYEYGGAQRYLAEDTSNVTIEESQCFCAAGTDEVIILNVNDLFNDISNDVDLGENVSLGTVEIIETIECDANVSAFDAEDLEIRLLVQAPVADEDAARFAVLFRNTYNDLVDGYCDGQFLTLTNVVIVITPQIGATPDADGCIPASTLVDSNGDCRGCSDGTPLVSEDPDADRRSLQEIRIDLGEILSTGTFDIADDSSSNNHNNERQRRRRMELNNACVCADDAIRDRGPTLLELYAALNDALQATPITSICGLTDEVVEDLPTLSPTEYVPHDVCTDAKELVLQSDGPISFIANDGLADEVASIDYFTTASANPDPGLSQAPLCSIGEVERGIWVNFTIPSPGVYQLESYDDSVPPQPGFPPPDTNIFVSLFSGDDCSTLTCIDTFELLRPAPDGEEIAERNFRRDLQRGNGVGSYPIPLRPSGPFLQFTDTDTTYHALVQSTPSLPIVDGILALVETCGSSGDILARFCFCARNAVASGITEPGQLVPTPSLLASPSLSGFYLKERLEAAVGPYYFVFSATGATTTLVVTKTRSDDCETFVDDGDADFASSCSPGTLVIKPVSFDSDGDYIFIIQSEENDFGSGYTGVVISTIDSPLANFCASRNSCYCSLDMSPTSNPGEFRQPFSIVGADYETIPDGCFDHDTCNINFSSAGTWFNFVTDAGLSSLTHLISLTTETNPADFTIFLFKSNEANTTNVIEGCSNFECITTNGLAVGETIDLESSTRYYAYVELASDSSYVGGDLVLLITNVAPPANDECVDAIALENISDDGTRAGFTNTGWNFFGSFVSDSSTLVVGDTLLANNVVPFGPTGDVNCDTRPNQPGVWFTAKLSPIDGSEDVTASAREVTSGGSSVDPTVTVFSSSDGGGCAAISTCVGQFSGSGGDLSFTMSTEPTYYFYLQQPSTDPVREGIIEVRADSYFGS